MNDDDLTTAVKESVAGVHMTVPAEQIMTRSRAIRARRRIPRLVAVAAVAAGAAVAVTTLLPGGQAGGHPGGHTPGRQPGSQLAAWSVVRHPGGTIAVTIHELFYPSGLQQKLRADGVPARVVFYAGSNYPASCRGYPASRALMAKVFPLTDVPTTFIEIRPSALPAGAGVYLNDSSNPYGSLGLEVGLVQASEQCTG